jgi:hypothetical protein
MPPDEPEELAIKRYEELYALAKSLYAAEHQRFDAAEAKVGRYLSFLVILFGLGAAAAGQVASVIKGPKDLTGWIFVIAYSLFAASIIGALVAFLRTLSTQTVSGPVLNDALLEHFQQNRYIDVIYSLTLR